MNYNKVIIGARLVRDPELRVTPKGTAICQFSVATSRRYKSDFGEQMEETSFIDCEAWGKTGELIQQHFTKGKAIFLDGRFKQDTWVDKTTNTNRSKIKVVVENFQFVGAKEEGASKPSPRPAHVNPGENVNSNLDEDVPF